MEYLGDTIESMVGAARSGFTVRQIPVAMRERTTGETAQGPAPPGTAMVAGGTAVLGAASSIHLAVAGHSLDKVDMAGVSMLWTLVMSVGIGLFIPIEQELTRIVAARAVRGEGAAPVLRKAGLLTAGSQLAVDGGLRIVPAFGCAVAGLHSGARLQPDPRRGTVRRPAGHAVPDPGRDATRRAHHHTGCACSAATAGPGSSPASSVRRRSCSASARPSA
ncbi:hypothetical protein [Streptomyces virginiae]|uniref:hypothetical protein n=1 Tax=Streptomyces virginiae TaxID=1961 RepID=UPI002250955F|nr:hypothetical protein [Streptomyces virginiae]MCX5273140.1 hypothetical protein [Streptomyces virginiae]